MTAQKGKEPASLEKELVSDKPITIGQTVGKKKIYTGRKVTLEFSDADVRKIFQLIAEVSNLNFLIADDVSGTISLKLVNVPWDQALDVILDSKNLEMKRDGNIVQIKPKGKFKTQEQEDAEAKREREKRMELITRVFPINFAALGDMERQFRELSSKLPGTSIISDARTNKIIVTDNETRLKNMGDLLVKLDTPEKQVMIEARIVEASSTFTRDLGVQWGIHYKDGSASFLGINQLDTGFGGVLTQTPPTSGFQGFDTAGGAMGLSFGKLTSNIQVDMRLSAAATAGLVKIISTPKVVTLNNKPAKISQGQSIPYQTTSAEGTKTQFVQATLSLEVTPHITDDGNIGMKITATNNSPGTGNPPSINMKEATTELQVMNGETTVIGGIYVDSDSESNSGVPFLMDIPLLGLDVQIEQQDEDENRTVDFHYAESGELDILSKNTGGIMNFRLLLISILSLVSLAICGCGQGGGGGAGLNGGLTVTASATGTFVTATATYTNPTQTNLIGVPITFSAQVGGQIIPLGTFNTNNSGSVSLAFSLTDFNGSQTVLVAASTGNLTNFATVTVTGGRTLSLTPPPAIADLYQLSSAGRQ